MSHEDRVEAVQYQSGLQVYLNPGAASPELRAKLEDAGIEVLEACSIMAAKAIAHERQE